MTRWYHLESSDYIDYTDYATSRSYDYHSASDLSTSFSTTGDIGVVSFGRSGDRDSPAFPWQTVAITVVCMTIIVGTVVGNALVCLAVALVRKLQTPSNLLIVSLAVSDLLVAVLVMPFALLMELSAGVWPLGEGMCKAWTSLDVLLCTASILNLCIISIDRYLAITRPLR